MDAHPERIGQYAIVGLLGEGGTGKVYLAEQTEPLKRTVALKVLEAVHTSERSLARFEIERLALAVMDHPAIAKIYDAGITDDGHPYVVMERVEGTPIGQYCDEHRLTIRQRVDLFAEACRAVHHAHQKGVIHRDLKPSHLLVAEVDGRPRLRIIDFGIAMALEREGHLDVGRDDKEVVGTPGYMSPEQMEGSADIDTRSDIYSLGVILYELLVGVSPFDTGRRRGWAAVAAQLGDLPTPTRRLISLDDTQDTLASHRSTTPRGLRKAIYGDLDAIVTRAMAKDRTRRYETAQELWLELERYLRYEPVGAANGGSGYRARKFVRRHRGGVAFGVLLVAGVTAYAVTAAVQAGRIAQARDEAELRRSQAEALIDFMLSDLRDRLEPLGRLDLLDAVGEQARDYLAATPERFVTDEDLFRRVNTLLLIGSVRDAQGDLAAARDAYEAALAVNLELVARAPDNTDWIFGLGQARYYVGFVDYRIGDYESALEQFLAYLEISDDLVVRDASNVGWLGELAYAHSNIGSVREDQGRLDEALAQFAEAEAIFTRLAELDSANAAAWRLDLADTHNTMGDVFRGQGRLAAARDEFAEEIRLKQQLVDSDPGNTFWMSRLAVGHSFQGLTAFDMGQLDSALAHYETAVDLFTTLVGVDGTNVRWRRNLATNRQRLANVLARRGSLAEALTRLSAVADVRGELASVDPADPGLRSEEASSYVDLADALLASGRVPDALARVRDGGAILDVLIADNPENRNLLGLRGSAYTVSGTVLARAGDMAGARDAWTSAAELLAPLAGQSNDPRYLAPWAAALLHLERADEARPLVERLQSAGYRNERLAELASASGVSNTLGT